MGEVFFEVAVNHRPLSRVARVAAMLQLTIFNRRCANMSARWRQGRAQWQNWARRLL